MDSPRKFVRTQIVFLISCFAILSSLSYRILYLKQISGAEFIALIIAAMFICLVGYFLKEIQEFSIGGSLIKLKEAKNDVEETVQELKKFRNELFFLLLSKSTEFSGGFGTVKSLKDERAENFINLYKQIESSKCLENLKDEIYKNITIILRGHLNQILELDKELKTKFSKEKIGDKFPEADEILLTVNAEMFPNFANQIDWDENSVKNEFESSIKIYRKLLEIKQKSI